MLGAYLGVRIIVHVVFLSDDDDTPIELPETSAAAPPPLQKRDLQNMKGRNFATSKIAPAKQEEKWQKLINFQSEMDGSGMPCIEEEQKNNIRYSNVVPHRSTDLTRSCLTSLSRREAVLS